MSVSSALRSREHVTQGVGDERQLTSTPDGLQAYWGHMVTW